MLLPKIPITMTDRRAWPRQPLVLAAAVEQIGRSTATLHGRTSDLCRGGCFIDVLNPMLQGTQIRLALRRGRQVFETIGSVASVDPGRGMGVEFTKRIASDQLAVLEGWLAGETGCGEGIV